MSINSLIANGYLIRLLRRTAQEAAGVITVASSINMSGESGNTCKGEHGAGPLVTSGKASLGDRMLSINGKEKV
ncbi:hypothetical protein BCR44DRAFT_394652 [Catenaria anguillulae PL171]|uniref:Uncharacterized protein n=1 Tax=Catenaria anguillulae PL171 TaxID=765915 RepID=A0A1Y2HEU7_9FUNG|nr:hypothetical protein BCR44DRAFT_394652 [Catenaria anguillulae PL171]